MHQHNQEISALSKVYRSVKLHANTCCIFLILSLLCSLSLPAKQIDTTKMNALFTSLEKRNEAMGSLIITKNCTILYKKAFGYRYKDASEQIKADSHTKYRIWSITKTFTATLIFQLIEEGKLSLDTRLETFYPKIPNAQTITLKQMLGHRSGIRDFTEDPAPPWDTEDKSQLTSSVIADRIATYKPSFQPGEDFRYSNSNYILLGYILESLEGMPYEDILEKRIAHKIGLSQTSYNQVFPNRDQNEAFTFRFDKEWIEIPEGKEPGLVPGAAGGIISTPADLAVFIEALFSGKLISTSSLQHILDKADTYGLGIYRNDFGEHIGYGHTGAYIASFSSLFYYPEDSLAVAYTTNGHVYEKDRILEHVLRIIHERPFAISWDRSILLGIFLLFAAAILGYMFKQQKKLLQPDRLISLGILIPVLFGLGQGIGIWLFGDYSLHPNAMLNLSSFYSNSGTFMALLQLSLAALSLAFLIGAFTSSKSLGLSVIPTIPILFLLVSFAGKALFPAPHPMAIDFDQVYILSVLGPLFTLLFWRKNLDKQTRTLLIVSLLLMLLPLGLFISRAYPAFMFRYGNLFQYLIHAGWALWFISLSLYLTNSIKSTNFSDKEPFDEIKAI